MKTGMICPSCKEAFLAELTILDDIEVTGFSMLSDGSIGMEGLVRDRHKELHCLAENRVIFKPRRVPVKATRSTAKDWS